MFFVLLKRIDSFKFKTNQIYLKQTKTFNSLRCVIHTLQKYIITKKLICDYNFGGHNVILH
jgi:membrane protein CcdC involved in cytochrome C biogenesis